MHFGTPERRSAKLLSTLPANLWLEPTKMLRLFVVVLTVTTFVSGQEWIHIRGKLTHASGSLTYVWGVNRGQQIFICRRPCTGSNWKHIPGHLVQVDVDDTEVWGVNKYDDIFKRSIDGSGNWQHIPGKLIHVSASGNGYIWGVNRGHAIFKCKKPCSGGGGWVHVPGGLKQIDGGEREVYGVNKGNQVFARPVDGSRGWRHIPGKLLKYISASGTYGVYGIDIQDKIYRCKKPCVGGWGLLSGRLRQCDATANALFGVNSADNIFRRDLPL